MRILLMLAVFSVGFLMPVQAGLNAVSADVAQSRLLACLINGLVYVAILLPVMLLVQAAGGKAFPLLAEIAKVPWWAHLAGVIGAALVLTQLTAAPQLGAALLVAIFVAGQAALSASLASAPGPSVTKAAMPVPLISCGMPTTAASTTAGCETRALSTSAVPSR